MAQKTVSRLYDHYQDALDTVRDLEAAGVPHSNISILASHNSHLTTTGAAPGVVAMGDLNDQAARDRVTGASAGATIGTVIGGGAGLLAGLGSMAIPGIGPIVAAGWLVSALAGAGAGAAAGGLLGALTGAGVDESEAHLYAEGVRRGGTLLTMRESDTDRVSDIEAILDRRSPVNTAARLADYQQAGWTGFNETGVLYTSEAVNLPDSPLRHEPTHVP
jgi:hypothetical protein